MTYSTLPLPSGYCDADASDNMGSRHARLEPSELSLPCIPVVPIAVLVVVVAVLRFHLWTLVVVVVVVMWCVIQFFFFFFFKLLYNHKFVFYTRTFVRTRTEPSEPEHCVHVCVHLQLEPNLEVQVQVRAQDPRTWTEPNPGQSIS
jgi:hypothetical protein